MKYYVILDMTDVVDSGFDSIECDCSHIIIFDSKSDAEDKMLELQQKNKNWAYFLFEAMSRTMPTGVWRGGMPIYRIDTL